MKNTQQQEILALLQQAGVLGVNSYDLTYKHAIKQAPTRIRELRLAGYQIKSKTNKNRSVTYTLVNSVASLVTTEPQKKIVQPREEELVPVEKGDRIYWEKPSDLEQRGLL